MEFKQIEAFVNVVKYKSFSKAADASFLTQPTISAHISTLEKELGVTLINRMGKESLPTKEGRELYKYGIDLLNTRAKAENAIKDERGKITGVLEIQSSSIPAQYIIPKLMGAFSKEHNNIRFYLEESDSRTVSRNITEQKGEIGFIGYKPDKELEWDYLCTDKCVVITPKTEKFRELKLSGRQIEIDDLRDESFIWRENGSATRRAFEDACTNRGIRINAFATLNGIEAIKRVVALGMGVSVLSQMAVEQNDENYFSFVLEDPKFNREFYMISKKNVTLSPVATEFRKLVLKHFDKKR